MIAAYASRLHYFDHLLPSWLALPEAERGRLCAPQDLAGRLRRRGLPAAAQTPQRGDLIVVAAGVDARNWRPRPVALVEHGAGQAYDVDDPGYSGGPRRENVELFLCPNPTVAARNLSAYPAARARVVGSPRVDALRSERQAALDRGERTEREPSRMRRPSGPPVVALSWHFQSPLRSRVPEAGSALQHYRPGLEGVLAELRAAGVEVIGHGHPRGAPSFARMWRRLGVQWVPDFADVVRLADAYACDNSSTLYEAAACGLPVVVMNAPWFRRELEAWPRFWSCADVGLQVEEPLDLAEALLLALSDPPGVAARRVEVVAEVFPLQDGRAAERSAHALLSVARGVLSAR